MCIYYIYLILLSSHSFSSDLPVSRDVIIHMPVMNGLDVARKLGAALQGLARWEAAGIGAPVPSSAELREIDGGWEVVCLSVAAPGDVGPALRRLARPVLGRCGDGALGRMIAGLVLHRLGDG